MILTKAYLGSTEIQKAYLGSTLVFDNTTPTSVLYDDVSVIYSLRTPSMNTLWANAVLKIRRSSDNTTAFVFIDGTAIDDTITLSSFISTSSNTTPSATTLTTWIGANDGFVEEWIGITPNNTIDPNKTATQTITTAQPQFISSGVIITKNGKPTIDFLSTTRYLNASANTDLDSGNTFSILSTSSNHNISLGAILNTTDTLNPKYVLYNDTSNTVFVIIRNQTTLATLKTASTESTLNQKLLTNITTSTNLDGWYNNTSLSSVAWSGIYDNVIFRIGAQKNLLNPLNGAIQEIIIFPSDKTADITDLHNDINTYYAIY